MALSCEASSGVADSHAVAISAATSNSMGRMAIRRIGMFNNTISPRLLSDKSEVRHLHRQYGQVAAATEALKAYIYYANLHAASLVARLMP